MASTHVLRNVLKGLSPKQALNCRQHICKISTRQYQKNLSAPALRGTNSLNQPSSTKSKEFSICTENARPLSSTVIKSSDVEVKTSGVKDDGDFDEYGISEETQRALRASGITKLFPVQTKAYKYVQLGKDVIVKARTGTGKTLAFALPLVEKLLDRQKRRGDAPKAIVLTPTRELANQIEEHTRKINRNTRLTCVYGGAKYEPQENAIRYGLDIVVGTPGRLKDMIQRGILDLTQLEHVVLDEVDRMLDMGFQDDVDEILGNCYMEASKPQTLLFSATVPPFVRQAARKYLSPDVLLIDLVGQETVQAATTVKQLALKCDYVDKKVLELLMKTYNTVDGKTIIFCNTKRECDQVSHNIPQARALHGDISQGQRDATFRGFKSGQYTTLVTTDLAARGLDIPNVELVIQTGPPMDADNFIHRTGRTGRAGNTGTAITIYNQENFGQMKNCERAAKTKLQHIQLPEYDCEKDIDRTISNLQRFDAAEAVYFMGDKARQLQQQMGEIESLSVALVLLSRTKQYMETSLLTKKKNYKTFQLNTAGGGQLSTSNVTAMLKGVLGEEIDKVEGLTLNDDKNIAVFDIPFSLVERLEDGITQTNSDNVTLSRLLYRLPEGIEASADDDSSSFDNSGSSSYGFSRFNDRQSRFGDRQSRYGDRQSRLGDRPERFDGRSNSEYRPDFRNRRFDSYDSNRSNDRFSRSRDFDGNRGFDRNRSFDRNSNFDRNSSFDRNNSFDRNFGRRNSNYERGPRNSSPYNKDDLYDSD